MWNSPVLLSFIHCRRSMKENDYHNFIAESQECPLRTNSARDLGCIHCLSDTTDATMMTTWPIRVSWVHKGHGICTLFLGSSSEPSQKSTSVHSGRIIKLWIAYWYYTHNPSACHQWFGSSCTSMTIFSLFYILHCFRQRIFLSMQCLFRKHCKKLWINMVYSWDFVRGQKVCSQFMRFFRWDAGWRLFPIISCII